MIVMLLTLVLASWECQNVLTIDKWSFIARICRSSNAVKLCFCVQPNLLVQCVSFPVTVVPLWYKTHKWKHTWIAKLSFVVDEAEIFTSGAGTSKVFYGVSVLSQMFLLSNVSVRLCWYSQCSNGMLWKFEFRYIIGSSSKPTIEGDGIHKPSACPQYKVSYAIGTSCCII